MKRLISGVLILGCTFLVVSAALLAAEQRRPGRLFPPEKIPLLEEPREWQKIEEVLEILKIKKGDVVADIGAGSGYFAFLFAKEVGEKGRVYAEEIQEEMIDFIGRKVMDQGIKNIVPVKGEPKDPHLPAESLDLAFLGNVYHEIEDPVALLKNTARGLKENGRLAIIDWSPDRESPVGPPREVRVPEHVVVEEAERAGFRLKESHALPYQYFLIFVKGRSAG